MPEVKQCPYCRQPFTPTRRWQKFCTTNGNQCRQAHHREKRKQAKLEEAATLEHIAKKLRKEASQ